MTSHGWSGFWRGKNAGNVYLGNPIPKGVCDVTRSKNARNVYLGNLIPKGVNWPMTSHVLGHGDRNVWNVYLVI